MATNHQLSYLIKPHIVKQALQIQEWHDAMKDEFTALTKNDI